jgi:protein SCO1/2
MALMKMLRRAGFALCAAALTLLAACDRFAATPAPSFKGVDITGAEYARSLSLPDTQGRMRSLDEFKGKVVVVFFGYTQCPDVCPTTMAELAAL